MNKRQKEVIQSQLNDEKAVLKAIEQNYKDALAEINSKIELLMARHDADMQHVIYQVEYQKALKTQIQAILETLQANEFETLSEYLAKAYEEGFFGAMYDMQGQGIPLVFPIDQAQVLEAIQTETNLSETLYAKLGKDIKDLQKKVAGEISRGLSTGMMMAEMARNIEALAKIPRNNAMRIARTEAHRIQTKAAYDAQWKAKDKGADIVKQWDATIDGKTRDSHRKIDGEIRELDEKFSNGLEYPGDPSGAAGEVINCRCALLQRARWNLENNFPKWTKGAHIADEDGTVQYVNIESKNFNEFKGYYRDITGQMTMNLTTSGAERVRSGAQKIKNEVVDLKEVTVNGVTYKVDGKHVILDNTQHEKDVANLISEYLGKSVKMVPRVVYPQGVSTPDYMIGNNKFDLKEPVGSGKHVLYNMINKKKSQADNFIFDITNCPLEYEDIKKQIDEIYKSSHTAFVNEIIIIENGKVKEKFNKKRN